MDPSAGTTVLQIGTTSTLIVPLTADLPGDQPVATAPPLTVVWTAKIAPRLLAIGLSVPVDVQTTAAVPVLIRSVGASAKGSVRLTHASLLAQGFGSPDDVTIGPDGVIYFTDYGNQGVNMFMPGGQPETLYRGIKEPEGVAVESNGNLIIADQQRNAALRLNMVKGLLSTVVAIPNRTGNDGIDGIAVDPIDGTILFPDSPNGRLLRISADGQAVTPLPGKYVRPTGLAKTQDGGYVVADEYGGRVYRIDSAGKVTPLGGRFATPDDVVVDSDGNVLVNSLGDGTIKSIAPDGGVATLLSGLSNPHGLAVDRADNIVVADSDHNRLLRLVRTFAIEPAAAGGPLGDGGEIIPLAVTRVTSFRGGVDWTIVSTPPGVEATLNANSATPDLALLRLSGATKRPGTVVVQAASGRLISTVRVNLPLG